MMGRLLLLGKKQYKPSWPGECIRRQIFFVLLLFAWFDCLLFLPHKSKMCHPFPSLAARIAYSNNRGPSLALTFRRNVESKVDVLLVWLGLNLYKTVGKWVIPCDALTSSHSILNSAPLLLSRACFWKSNTAWHNPALESRAEARFTNHHWNKGTIPTQMKCSASVK